MTSIIQQGLNECGAQDEVQVEQRFSSNWSAHRYNPNKIRRAQLKFPAATDGVPVVSLHRERINYALNLLPELFCKHIQ